MKISNEQLFEIAKLTKENLSIKEISDKLNIKYKSVYSFVKNEKRLQKYLGSVPDAVSEVFEKIDDVKIEIPCVIHEKEIVEEVKNENDNIKIEVSESESGVSESENELSESDVSASSESETNSKNNIQNEINEILNNSDSEPTKKETIKEPVINPIKIEYIKNEIEEPQRPQPPQPPRPPKKNIKQNNENEQFIDLVNIPSGSVDDLKKRRSKIIVIRQYIQNFKNELQSVIGPNEKQFIAKLITKSFEDLDIIYNNIRFELNLKTNEQNFYRTVEIGAVNLEKLVSMCGFDISGGYDAIKNDDDFKMTLKMIASETDISSILSPKHMLFIQLIKSYYMQYNKNKIEKMACLDQLNDNDKFKELNKNFKDI